MRKSDPGLKHGYRSGLEEKIADDLKALGIPVCYEEEKIKYVKPSKPGTYTPDFVIPLKDIECGDCHGSGDEHDPAGGCFKMPCSRCNGTGQLSRKIIVETKGRFVTADRLKHLEIKKQHPRLDIRFVFQNSRQRISKSSKTTYAAWCEKNGFLYADKKIPDAWLEEAKR